MTDYYALGALVPLTFTVTDEDGEPAAPGGYTLTVYKPDATTASPTVANPELGTYQADYVTTVAGRHVARFVTTGLNAGVVEQVFDVTVLSLAIVTVDEVRTYLGDTSALDAEIADALGAEQAAQARRCRINPYHVDLRQALLRRVARNLAARAVPVATFTSFEGGGTSSRVPQTDAEIMRLEAPYRRWVVG